MKKLFLVFGIFVLVSLSFASAKNITFHNYTINADYFIGDGSQLTNLPAGTETDPYWTGNQSLYYNKTDVDTNITTTNNSIANWVDNLFVRFTELVSQIGNWSADKSSYYNKTDVDTNITSANTSMKNYVDGTFYLDSNPFSFYNSTTIPSYLTEETNWNANYSDFLSVSAWNDTGLIRDWNATGLIIDWNSSSYIIDWNSTGYIRNWEGEIVSANTSLYNWVVAQGYGSGDSIWTNSSGNATFTTGNVGIGTTSPTSKLQIGDSLGTFTDNRIAIGSSSGYPGVIFGVNNTYRGYMVWQVDANRVNIGTVTDGTVIDTIILKNGSVGIGTTTPSAKLHIQDGLILVNSSSGRTVQLGDDTSTHYSHVGTTSNHNFRIIAGNVEYIRADNSAQHVLLAPTVGNVGIGTNTPSKRLEVNGTSGAITFDPNVATPTINTTANNLSITSSGGSVIITLG